MIITVVGNLTADPELRHVASAGKDVVNFTIADSKNRTRSNQIATWIIASPEPT